MSPWKVILAMALTLPPVAYVAGALAAQHEEPTPRSPIVVTGVETPPPSHRAPSGSPSPRMPPSPVPTSGPGSSDDVDVIKPRPDDVDDDNDDDRRRGEGGPDDDSDDSDGGDDD